MRDLVPYNFRDETSQFDPEPKEWNGECYMREFTAYVPARLLRRRPDLVDDFIAKHSDATWLWKGYAACSCGAHCFKHDDSPDECGGIVGAIDEMYTDDDYWFIHACPEHADEWR